MVQSFWRSAEKMLVEDDNIDLFPAHVTKLLFAFKNRHKYEVLPPDRCLKVYCR